MTSEFVAIGAGSFPMTIGDRVVRVNVTKGFSIAKYVVTQKVWRQIMGNEPWLQPKVSPNSVISQSAFDGQLAQSLKIGDDFPAVFVSWDDAVLFCSALSRKMGSKYSLPTEAQWELACRSGSSNLFPWGNDVADYESASRYAWYRLPRSRLRSSPTLQRVGLLTPNEQGIYDMCGLVKEWVLDRHVPTDGFDVRSDYYSSEMDDPVNSNGTHAMARNGSFDSPITALAFSRKILHTPENRQVDIGFRVVRNDG